MNDAVRAAPDPEATSVHLAWLRTRMAVERTLMAWLRTSTALLTFGFGLVQFFDWFYKTEEAGRAVHLPLGPKVIGLTLSVTGIVSLVISLRQYRQLIAHLSSEPYAEIAGVTPVPHHTPLAYVAVALVAVGAWTLWTVLAASF